MNPVNSQFTAAFFDESSTAWRANKIMKPNATYSYKCRSVLKSGKACPLAATTLEQTCKRHAKTLVSTREPSALVSKLESSALVSKLESSALVSKLEPGPSLRHLKDVPPLHEHREGALA
jgi:hypothetical protein